MPELSVIVPIYNAEQTLRKCLDSILSQTFKDIEILLINDGSTDSSQEICEEYALKDKRIKVYCKVNGGQSSARNYGLSIAQGKYIGFIDSDDWISKDMYEYLLTKLKDEGGDLIRGGRIETYNHVLCKQKKFREEIFTDEAIVTKFLRYGYINSVYGVVSYVYKKSLFDTVIFPEGLIHEDIITNFKIHCQASKLIWSDKIVYYYFQTPGSTTRRKFRLKDLDLLTVTRDVAKICNETSNADWCYWAKLKTYRSYFSFLSKIAFYGAEPSIPDISSMIKEYTKSLRQGYRLLLRSPMPVNRKIIMSFMCIHFQLVAFPFCIYRRFQKKDRNE